MQFKNFCIKYFPINNGSIYNVIKPQLPVLSVLWGLIPKQMIILFQLWKPPHCWPDVDIVWRAKVQPHNSVPRKIKLKTVSGRFYELLIYELF